jgi:hypothetical protein
LGNGQQTILFENFENSFSWSITNSGNNSNHWEWGQQAGNGNTYTGSHSLYVADNIGVFNYNNSIGVPETTIIYKQIYFPGIYSTITMEWDFTGNGDGLYDLAQFVYKKTNPTVLSGWYISTPLQNVPGWAHVSFTFASSSFFSNYVYVGFLFTCNNNGVYTPSFAVDNLKITAVPVAPLSIDTTQAPTQQQHFVRDNPIEAIYNLNGQAVSDTSEGCFIVRRKYSTEKIIKQ